LPHPIRILQISDSHLFVDSKKRLLGLDTEASFHAVVDLAKAEQAQHDIALVLATGDVAQDCSTRAYEYYKKVVEAEFKAPILWLPGNHDDSKLMTECLKECSERVSPCAYDLDKWTIIMLDSSVQHEVYGLLKQDQLDYLDRTLSEKTDQHVMVCLHHHPILCGSHWLDGHNLKNAKELWAILHKYPNVKTLVWGHIHQEFHAVHEVNGHAIQCFAPPSTCIQFKPRCYDFALDTLNPGYRWFDLYSNGDFKTGISRTEQSFQMDMQSKGY